MPHRPLAPCAFVLSMLLAGSVAAQEAGPPPVPPPAHRPRHGLFGGVALYGGNISCEGSNCGDFRKAGGGGFHIGWMLYPRLGVLLDAWAMTSSENNVDISYVSGTIAGRYFLARPLWVQAGIGNGHAEVHVGGFAARGDDVPAVMLAAGLELLRGPSWALDLEAKLAWGSATDSNGDASTGRMAGLGVGLTWYSH